METAAFSALLAYAHLLGVAPVPPAPSPAPREELRIPLSEISAQQARSQDYEPVGRGGVGFTAALDDKAELWIRLRQQDQNAAFPLAAFDKGVDVDFPVERVHALVENGVIRAYPVDEPQTPQAHVMIPDLLRALVTDAEHVLFTPVDYAVLYENDGLVPPSLSLVREDQSGRYYVNYHSVAELAQISWFVSIDGTMHGVEIDGKDVVFFSKPAPPAAPPRAERLVVPPPLH